MNAGIDFLEFKPSEIAAAVATFVASEKHTTDVVDKAVSGFISSVVEKVFKKYINEKSLSGEGESSPPHEYISQD